MFGRFPRLAPHTDAGADAPDAIYITEPELRPGDRIPFPAAGAGACATVAALNRERTVMVVVTDDHQVFTLAR